MSTPLSYRAPCPPRRNAACLVIGIGCLLTAGSVLSSVAKPAPAEPASRACLEAHSGPTPVYAVADFGRPRPAGARPLQALVRLQSGSLQITNTSADCWRDIQLQVGRTGGNGARSRRFARLGPYETFTVPLNRVYDLIPACAHGHVPLPIEWRCHTPHGAGIWAGYMFL